MFSLLLFRRNEELIQELSTPTPDSKELYFPTKYSQSFFVQCKANFWKQYWSYWRYTQYNAVRFLMTIGEGIMFGAIFWNKARKTYVIKSFIIKFAFLVTIPFWGLLNKFWWQRYTTRFSKSFGSHVLGCILSGCHECFNSTTSCWHWKNYLLPWKGSRDVLCIALCIRAGTYKECHSDTLLINFTKN